MQTIKVSSFAVAVKSYFQVLLLEMPTITNTIKIDVKDFKRKLRFITNQTKWINVL